MGFFKVVFSYVFVDGGEDLKFCWCEVEVGEQFFCFKNEFKIFFFVEFMFCSILFENFFLFLI